jgi:hypothetical protein
MITADIMSQRGQNDRLNMIAIESGGKKRVQQAKSITSWRLHIATDGQIITSGYPIVCTDILKKTETMK